MALVFLEGFDTYGDNLNTRQQPNQIIYSKWADWGQFEDQCDNENGRASQGYSMQWPSSTWASGMRTLLNTTNDTIIVGWAGFRQNPTGLAGAQANNMVVLRSDATVCLKLIISKDSLFVEMHDGVVLASRSKIQRTAWSYYEIKVKSSTTTGTVEVRVNGAAVIKETGLDTKPSGAGTYFNELTIGGTGTTAMTFFHFDDMYVCDGSGSTNNDFLGDVTVQTLFPDGDDSVNYATTGNANYANHYQQVGFEDALSTSDYIEDSTTGNRDIFTVDNSINFATVHGVITGSLSLYTTSSTDYTLILDSNGTETESANITPTSSHLYDEMVVELNPDTSSAWTPSTINAMKIGTEIK